MKYEVDVWHIFYQATAELDDNLAILESGYKKCLPSHSYGPAVRDYYVLHFVSAGKGVLVKGTRKIGTHRYTVKPGQGFLICPNETTVYTADAEEPWHYYWVGFTGTKAAELIKNCRADGDNPVFDFELDGALHEYIHKFVLAPAASPAVNHIKLGWLYLILSELIIKKAPQKIPNIVKYATEYIEKNYTADISVRQIAERCFIDRSHFFRVFKAALGVAPHEYIIDLRLNKSCDYLRSSNYSVTYISQITGFSDSSQYCKMFKKKFGESPAAWRKKHTRVNMQ